MTDDAPVSGTSPKYLTEPAAKAAGSVVPVGEESLHWQPWATPVLLDARTGAILQAFDGSPIEDLAQALAEVEQRPLEQVRFELEMVARHLAGNGLLEDARVRPRWSPAALNRPVTPCDSEAWNLSKAQITDLVVGGRKATCIVGDPEVFDVLTSQDHFEVLGPPEDIMFTPIELILAMAPGPRGVHRLFGRAGRVLTRSTDRDEVVRAFFSNLDSLAWTRSSEEQVWLDAAALSSHTNGVALLSGRALYDWARMARPLERAGYALLETPMVAISVEDGRVSVVAPPAPDPAVVAMAHKCMGDDRPVRPDTYGDLTVRRIDLIATDEDMTALRDNGHDPDAIDAGLAAQRLALLAHTAALDIFPEDPPPQERTMAILQGVANLALTPGVRTRAHSQIKDLTKSLTS
ncbi:MAG: hypothetical protein KDB02_14730 [Acidimicrobiales bacterium]|nr:hypothetical protein [Acidimicrobiales bacterium]